MEDVVTVVVRTTKEEEKKIMSTTSMATTTTTQPRNMKKTEYNNAGNRIKQKFGYMTVLGYLLFMFYKMVLMVTMKTQQFGTVMLLVCLATTVAVALHLSFLNRSLCLKIDSYMRIDIDDQQPATDTSPASTRKEIVNHSVYTPLWCLFYCFLYSFIVYFYKAFSIYHICLVFIYSLFSIWFLMLIDKEMYSLDQMKMRMRMSMSKMKQQQSSAAAVDASITPPPNNQLMMISTSTPTPSKEIEEEEEATKHPPNSSSTERGKKHHHQEH